MALVNRGVSPATYKNEEVVETPVVDKAVVERQHSANVAERVIWWVAGLLLTLLALRFVFALFGANPNNWLASFVYSVTRPFVAPFFNLFNYHYVNGLGRFEVYTLVAMVIYALIAWGLARLVTIRRP